MTDKIYNVLSLGAGVQSTAMLLLSTTGKIPLFSHCIFADTGWEGAATYESVKFCKEQAEKAGIKFIQVSKGNIREKTMALAAGEITRAASLPLFVLNNGKKGMTMRGCTTEYKLQAIIKGVREQVLGLKFRQRGPKHVAVKMSIGITKDEALRAKPNTQQKWCENIFPFLNWGCEWFDKDWSRQDCIDYLDKEWPGIKVSRSACIGCPYKSDKEWMRLSEEEFQDAVEFDRAIRKLPRLDGDLFLHSKRIPLDQVKFIEHDEPDLFNQECEGMCGL